MEHKIDGTRKKFLKLKKKTKLRKNSKNCKKKDQVKYKKADLIELTNT